MVKLIFKHIAEYLYIHLYWTVTKRILIVPCIFFDCLASYLAYLWNAMRLKQRVGYIEHINEGDLNNIATFCKLENTY